MRVTVRLFAIARERAGAPTIELELPANPTVADLRASLGAAVPGLIPALPAIRFSVNAEYADDATPIPLHAELAAIPPVSGG